MRDTLKQKLNRRKQLAKKRNDPVMGMCVDCGHPCLLSDSFIVKDATWAEAGLSGWGAGHLHLPCFKKRLGRDLKEDEMLVRVVGGQRFEVRPEYFKRPESLEHI